MNEPSPELEQQVKASYSQLEPDRVYQGCKFAQDEKGTIVRVYSQPRHRSGLLPPPYRVFRFDATTGALIAMADDEAAIYQIKNYK